MSTESAKYPRTPHLPCSPGAGSDDKVLGSVDHLLNIPVVLTEKMDGSNLCMTRHAVFARSHNGPPTHPSFDFAKQLHGELRHAIPDGFSVFGEYLYAVHSIVYSDLPGHFLVFGVREDTTGKWWSWEMVKQMAEELRLPTVPYMATKMFRRADDFETVCKALTTDHASSCGETTEGVVLRVAEEYTDPSVSVAKYVRANHVQTTEHWTHQEIRKNGLRK